MEAIRLALRSSTILGAVVSSTDTRSSLPATLYSLESIRSRAASENADTSDLASNILAARSGIDTPRSAAKASATARSCGVVVGERNSSVSDRMQDSIAPLMALGARAMSEPIRSCITVAVQARGRMVMSIGVVVLRPPTSM